MTMHIVTANRLSDGAVVYLTGSRVWSGWIADALVCETRADAQSALERARTDAGKSGVADPYLIDVRREAQTIRPIRYREAVRARGPSIYTAAGVAVSAPPHGSRGSRRDGTSASGAFLNGL